MELSYWLTASQTHLKERAELGGNDRFNPLLTVAYKETRQSRSPTYSQCHRVWLLLATDELSTCQPGNKCRLVWFIFDDIFQHRLLRFGRVSVAAMQINFPLRNLETAQFKTANGHQQVLTPPRPEVVFQMNWYKGILQKCNGNFYFFFFAFTLCQLWHTVHTISSLHMNIVFGQRRKQVIDEKKKNTRTCPDKTRKQTQFS